jgi:putative Ca2+/H+ antiporter (TMEM165/GDT1 family)
MVLDTFFSSFSLVAVSEMGDKTQLLAFSLAARFRKPVPILAGILVATLANHALAALAGTWISAQIAPRTLALVLGVLFIAFALWTLKPDTLEENAENRPANPFLATVALFFLAEMGDKTQFATVALAAKYAAPVWVTVGTTCGMMVTDGLAVLLGNRIADRVQMRAIRIFAALLFFAFGVASLLEAYS